MAAKAICRRNKTPIISQEPVRVALPPRLPPLCVKTAWSGIRFRPWGDEIIVMFIAGNTRFPGNVGHHRTVPIVHVDNLAIRSAIRCPVVHRPPPAAFTVFASPGRGTGGKSKLSSRRSRWAAALSNPTDVSGAVSAGGTTFSGCRKCASCSFPHVQCDSSGPSRFSISAKASSSDIDSNSFACEFTFNPAKTARGFVRGTGNNFAVSFELNLVFQTS